MLVWRWFLTRSMYLTVGATCFLVKFFILVLAAHSASSKSQRTQCVPSSSSRRNGKWKIPAVYFVSLCLCCSEKKSEREKRVNRAINVVIYTTLSQWSLTIIRQSYGRPHGHHGSSFMGVSRRRCQIPWSDGSSFTGVSRRRSSFTGVSRRRSQIPWSHSSSFTGVSRGWSQIPRDHVFFFLSLSLQLLPIEYAV